MCAVAIIYKILAPDTCYGQLFKAVPVAASWHAFHEAAIILDAIQDQDPYLNQEISAAGLCPFQVE